MLCISTMKTATPTLLVTLLTLLLAGCTTPVPRPAMVAYGQTGDFGYQERDLGEGRYEVGYLGSWISLSWSESRTDPRLEAEREKVRDLALWRAAQLADEKGAPSFKLEHEEIDNEIERRSEPVYRGFPRYWRPWWPYRPWWFYDDPYDYDVRRRASGRVKATLTIALQDAFDRNDSTQRSVLETLAHMKATRADAAY